MIFKELVNVCLTANIAFDKGTHWQMFVPQNGTLVLFNVEDNRNKHMVTNVAVDNTRYAITGWLI